MKTTKTPTRRRTPQRAASERTMPLLIGIGAGAALTIGLVLATRPIAQPPPAITPITPTLAAIEERTVVTAQLQPDYQGINSSPLAIEKRSTNQPPTEETTTTTLEALLQEPEGASQAINPSQETLPMGFGLLKPEELPASNTNTKPTADPNKAAEASQQESPLAENPLEGKSQDNPTQPSALPPNAQNQLPDTDPRSLGITANEGPNKEYEETVMSVQRSLTAVLDNGEKQLIRLKIPVLYQSRTLRLDNDQRAAAKTTLSKLKTKQEELAKFKTEIEQILKEWNGIVEKTTPHNTLLPESPSLPQNQSNNSLNRESPPALSAGKNITYEIPKK